MENINYQKIGFKAGLELHQQLSGTKLFCRCPVITNKTEKPDVIIKRKIRAIAGVEGKKDIAALYEEQKDKIFVYEYYHETNCLFCIDEEPVNELNHEALEAGLKVALLLKAKPIKNIKVMRKIILDGSCTSSFQRTCLIAENGKIETSKGIVRIPTILLEEEAAKKISTNGKEVTFRLDRLGIPLLEIATSPDIKDPEHAKETAEIIGMVLRSVDLVKRGLGSTRQDINVSIKNSPRIEIKGFQDLKSIPKIVEYEVLRLQHDSPKEGEVRKAEPDLTTSYMRPLAGDDRFYPETDAPNIEITKDLLKKIKLPELLTEKTIKLEKKFNISQEIAEELIKNKINLEDYTKDYKEVSPSLISQTLITTPKEIRARFHFTPKLKEEDFRFVFENLNKQKISKDSILDILVDLAKGKKPDLDKFKKISDKDLEKEIEKIIAENQNAPFNALMGMAMEKLKKTAEGKKVAETIRRFI